MTTPRDAAIAAATALVDALIAAARPAPVAPPPPPPSPDPVPVPPPVTPPIVPGAGHPRVMLGSQGARLKAALTSTAGARWLAAWRLDGVMAGAATTLIAIDGATNPATSTVQFADVGCSFTLAGKAITLGAGFDPPTRCSRYPIATPPVPDDRSGSG